MGTCKYIEDRKEYRGPEFAELAGVEYRPEHDEIAAMGCYTMLHHIADNFRGGKFRSEILKTIWGGTVRTIARSVGKYLPAGLVSVFLAMAGFTVLTWEFWALLVPFAVVMVWHDQCIIDEYSEMQ